MNGQERDLKMPLNLKKHEDKRLEDSLNNIREMSSQEQIYFADRLSSAMNPDLSTDIIKKNKKNKYIHLSLPEKI